MGSALCVWGHMWRSKMNKKLKAEDAESLPGYTAQTLATVHFRCFPRHFLPACWLFHIFPFLPLKFYRGICHWSAALKSAKF